MVFFQLIRIHYLLLQYLHVIFLDEFLESFCERLWCIFYVLWCKGDILCSSWSDDFWNRDIFSICVFGVNACENLDIFVFNEDVQNSQLFKAVFHNEFYFRA